MKLRKFISLAIGIGTSSWSHGAVTFVDPVDIVIPSTLGGVYLNIETAAENGSSQSGTAEADSYTISYSEPAPGDWDVNFFFGGAFIAHSTTFQPYRADSGDNLSAIDQLGISTVVDGTPIDPAPASGASSPLASANFGASGTTTGGDLNGDQSPTHMGPSADQFSSGSLSQGYIAFVLNPETTPLYGWMNVSLSDDGSTGLIHEWAYSDTPIAVGQIPEPGSSVLLLLSTVCLLRRSRA